MQETGVWLKKDSESNMVKIIYIANILVAGWISISSLFSPKAAQLSVFGGSIAYSESIRLVGTLKFAIFILSILGLFYSEKMQLVFLFQLIYKFSWLVFVALPAIVNHNPYPKGMAAFFIAWVIILPFVVPRKTLFS